jgi:WD40 repeat protein
MAAVPVIPAFLKKTIVTDLLTKPSEEVDPAYIFNVVLGKDKSIVAASSSTNAIKIYDFNTQALVSQCVGHSETITEIVFSPTEPFVLYSSSMDGTIGTWDVRTGESTGTLKCMFIYSILRTTQPFQLDFLI